MTKKIILQWHQMQGKSTGLTSHLLESGDTETWVPNTDVCEGPDNAVVKVELPGVTPENLELLLDERSLIIRGVRPDPACEESAAGYRFRQLEIQYGVFHRVIPLPYLVDGENIAAHLRNGILEIRLPRAQVGRRTAIDVIVES